MKNCALPYRLYAAVELAEVESRARARCEQWLQEWAIVESMVEVEARPVLLSDLSGLEWLLGDEALPAMVSDADACRFFSALCLGVNKSPAALDASALAGPVLNAARLALGRHLSAASAACLYRGHSVSAHHLPPLYSAVGALCLSLRIADQALTLLLSPEQVVGLLPLKTAPAALAPLRLRDLPLTQAVELEVRAAPARLSLEDLDSLCPGDVIRLDQKADGLFELCLVDGSILGRAQYGLQHGRPAVKVARLAPPNNKE